MGKWIMLIATVGGMGITMMYAGKLGAWIEKKVQAWLRRKNENKGNS